MRPIAATEVDGLRSIFQIGSSNVLDGRRLLVVDEQSETGDTLRVASELFSRAFPSSSVSTMAWITSTAVSGQRQVRKIPSWYPLEGNWSTHEDQTGRGVFNPVGFDAQAPAHSSRFPPESYPYLCVPAPQDAASRQLRVEVKRLHEDFVAGVIWPMIATERCEIRGMAPDDYRRQAAAVRRRR